MKLARKTVLLLALLAPACGGGGDEGDFEEDDKPQEPDPIPNAAPVPPPSNLACPSGTPLNWDNFGEGFLLSYCTACHSSQLPEGQRGEAPLAASFDTPDGVQLWRAAMLTKATGDKATMPPSGQVPGDEKAQFTEWLNCGAPTGTDHVK